MHQVLRGITKRDYRATIAGLMDEGWDVERTPGGHIKLIHAEAMTPVFAASSPSDVRAYKKVVSNCRQALAGNLSNASPPSDQTDKSDINYEEIMRKRKKSSGASQRAARQLSTPKAVMPVSETTMSIIGLPENMAKLPPVKQSAKAGTTASASFASDKTDAKPISIDKMEVLMKSLDTKTQPSIGANAPGAPTAKPAPVAVEATVTVLPVTQQPTPQPMDVQVAAPAAAAGINYITADVLALAMKIAAGSMQQLVITADMVGQTLYHEGEVVMVGGGQSVVAKKPLVAQGTLPVVRAKTDESSKRTILLDSFKAFGSSFVSVDDLATLNWQEMGYKNQDSCRVTIRRSLKLMHAAGTIEKDMQASKASYRLI